MKKNLLITMLLGMLLLLAVKTEVSAAELERTYFVVIDGTATKLGTEQVENVKEDVYLDEWQVQENCILSESVADVLLKSSNAELLALNSTKLDYASLKELAGAEDGEVIYQGYAQLKLKYAHDGYTFGIVCQENDNEQLRVTGYYAELHNKGIYKIELICKKITKEEFLETYCKPPVQEVEYIPMPSSTPDSTPSPEPSPSPAPSPSPTPTPPAPPTTRPILPPSVPVPVIPGA